MEKAFQGVAFGIGQATGRLQEQPGKLRAGEVLATGLWVHAPGAPDHAYHALRAPIAALDTLLVEPSGMVAPLGPALGKVAQIRV
jgi:hypothetical protein